ncbi:MAG: FmdE family protein [Candidatus Natronoplasma sp.]
MSGKKTLRKDIWDMISQGDLDNLLDRAAVLHGHYCPGLALGVNAAHKAVKEMNVEPEGMEKVLAIMETNNCASDGVQFVTGCTFGNNSLIFRDLGKTAITLTKRDGTGIRLVTKPDAGEEWSDEFPEYSELFEKVVTNREGDEEDHKKFNRLAKKVSHHVVKIPAEDLFKIEEIEVEIPEYAPIHDSHVCDDCGENVMATRTVEKNGKILCLECSDSRYPRLTGFGIETGDQDER